MKNIWSGTLYVYKCQEKAGRYQFVIMTEYGDVFASNSSEDWCKKACAIENDYRNGFLSQAERDQRMHAI